MTLSLQQSISVKDKLFKNFINKKDPILNFTLTKKKIEKLTLHLNEET